MRRRASRAVAGLALLLLGPACTSDDPSPPSASPATVRPVTPPVPGPGGVTALFVARPAAPQGTRGGRAVVAVEAEAAVLDPFAPGGDTPAARDLAPLWLPGLWRREPDGRRSPWLAAGLPQVSPDGVRVTVDLRTDARWSDGSAITSADIAATWRRAATSPGPWRSAYAELLGVETPTPSRVVLVQRQAGTGWARLFAAPTGVLPAARLGGLGQRAYDLRVTGGPFVLGPRSVGLRTAWRRTPHAWPGSDPLLDELVTEVVPDFTTATQLLERERVDAVAPYLALRPTERLAAKGGGRAAQGGAGRSIVLIGMRTDVGPLQDLRVRQAIAQGLDRPAFAEALVRADGVLADDVAALGSAGAGTPFARWRRDVGKADRLLDAAGWSARSGGRARTRSGAELTLVVAVPSPNDLLDVVVRGIAQQLRELGILLDLATADADRAGELVRTGQADLWLTRWDTDEVSDLARLVGSSATAPAGANLSRFRDAATDRALAAFAAATDLRTAADRLPAVTARLADQLPVLPLVSLAPVSAGRDVTPAGPVSGYGGPFAAADRWRRG